MSMQEDPDAKTFDPTPQKLLEARKKGEVAKSNDLMTAAAYFGMFSALVLAGPTSIETGGNALMALLDQSTDLATLLFDDAPTHFFGALMWPVLKALVPLFGLPASAVLLAIVAQKALLFTPSKLMPKVSRISLIANAKNKYGRAGIFEWVKSFTKLSVYSVVLAIFVANWTPDMIAVLQTEPHLVLALLTTLCVRFLFLVVILATAIGGIDAIWQHIEHHRKNKMSHKEIAEETKTNEGDPHLKQERRQRAMSVSQNQMMAKVPNADVIIVNPTHYAVALKWSRAKGDAPICVAKGVDEIAKAIRHAAQEAGVPVHSDPPTARALHQTTQIGDQISPDFFQAVAAAIRFAEAMRHRAKSRI